MSKASSVHVFAVDHVQFGVRDPMAAAEALQPHGYRTAFREPAFNTVPRPYFRGVDKAMAYLLHGASRIELVTCSGAEIAGRYLPVFGATEPGRGGLIRFCHPVLHCACAAHRGDADTLDGLVVNAVHPERSAGFWRLLGFAPAAQNAGGFRLAFPHNIATMPLALCIVPCNDQPAAEARADDPGCCCVALITRDLDADRAALQAAGYAMTVPAEYRINGRDVAVGFVAGPSGELVELLQPARAR